LAQPLLNVLWAALGGDRDRAGDLEVRGRARYLPSAFDVDGLAVAAVGSALLAAAELARARGAPRPRAELDAGHVACAFASERHLLRDGAPPGPTFAPLSRFARAGDGWIRLHANYDHHRRALLAALGSDEEHALDAVARRSAGELEEAIVAAGGAAAAVCTADAWAQHPQGRAIRDVALVARRPAGAPPALPHGGAAPRRPADGVRVLDLTRVIAGPVATRFLAALGADVLRIDPPRMPEAELGILDTCPGKRLAGLDLRERGDAEALERLLAGADVLVQGYRPGALAALGLGEDALAERHPHLTVASLSAWGDAGPWARRRGFDSLVQAACGIAIAEGSADAPGALPVQALDHATGYLIAAAVLRELAARERGDRAGNVRLALAATAAELMRHRADAAAPAADAACDGRRVTLEHRGGALSVIAPPGSLDGKPLRFAHGPRHSAPRWH
jgi:crotonobetainyl-CoA:carnitine CoA-transferase CaiB-like acyl-CoA transferase